MKKTKLSSDISTLNMPKAGVLSGALQAKAAKLAEQAKAKRKQQAADQTDAELKVMEEAHLQQQAGADVVAEPAVELAQAGAAATDAVTGGALGSGVAAVSSTVVYGAALLSVVAINEAGTDEAERPVPAMPTPVLPALVELEFNTPTEGFEEEEIVADVVSVVAQSVSVGVVSAGVESTLDNPVGGESGLNISAAESVELTAVGGTDVQGNIVVAASYGVFADEVALNAPAGDVVVSNVAGSSSAVYNSEMRAPESTAGKNFTSVDVQVEGATRVEISALGDVGPGETSLPELGGDIVRGVSAAEVEITGASVQEIDIQGSYARSSSNSDVITGGSESVDTSVVETVGAADDVVLTADTVGFMSVATQDLALNAESVLVFDVSGERISEVVTTRFVDEMSPSKNSETSFEKRTVEAATEVTFTIEGGTGGEIEIQRLAIDASMATIEAGSVSGLVVRGGFESEKSFEAMQASTFVGEHDEEEDFYDYHSFDFSKSSSFEESFAATSVSIDIAEQAFDISAVATQFEMTAGDVVNLNVIGGETRSSSFSSVFQPKSPSEERDIDLASESTNVQVTGAESVKLTVNAYSAGDPEMPVGGNVSIKQIAAETIEISAVNVDGEKRSGFGTLGDFDTRFSYNLAGGFVSKSTEVIAYDRDPDEDSSRVSRTNMEEVQAAKSVQLKSSGFVDVAMAAETLVAEAEHFEFLYVDGGYSSNNVNQAPTFLASKSIDISANSAEEGSTLNVLALSGSIKLNGPLDAFVDNDLVTIRNAVNQSQQLDVDMGQGSTDALELIGYNIEDLDKASSSFENGLYTLVFNDGQVKDTFTIKNAEFISIGEATFAQMQFSDRAIQRLIAGEQTKRFESVSDVSAFEISDIVANEVAIQSPRVDVGMISAGVISIESDVVTSATTLASDVVSILAFANSIESGSLEVVVGDVFADRVVIVAKNDFQSGESVIEFDQIAGGLREEETVSGQSVSDYTEVTAARSVLLETDGGVDGKSSPRSIVADSVKITGNFVQNFEISGTLIDKSTNNSLIDGSFVSSDKVAASDVVYITTVAGQEKEEVYEVEVYANHVEIDSLSLDDIYVSGGFSFDFRENDYLVQPTPIELRPAPNIGFQEIDEYEEFGAQSVTVGRSNVSDLLNVEIYATEIKLLGRSAEDISLYGGTYFSSKYTSDTRPVDFNPSTPTNFTDNDQYGDTGAETVSLNFSREINGVSVSALEKVSITGGNLVEVQVDGGYQQVDKLIKRSGTTAPGFESGADYTLLATESITLRSVQYSENPDSPQASLLGGDIGLDYLVGESITIEAGLDVVSEQNGIHTIDGEYVILGKYTNLFSETDGIKTVSETLLGAETVDMEAAALIGPMKVAVKELYATAGAYGNTDEAFVVNGGFVASSIEDADGIEETVSHTASTRVEITGTADEQDSSLDVLALEGFIRTVGSSEFDGDRLVIRNAVGQSQTIDIDLGDSGNDTLIFRDYGFDEIDSVVEQEEALLIVFMNGDEADTFTVSGVERFAFNGMDGFKTAEELLGTLTG